MSRLDTVCGAMIWIIALAAGSATAQMNAAISDGELQEPWVQSRAVVQTLADAVETEDDPVRRTQFDRDLDVLERDLAELQAQVENVAISIASNIGYAYTAEEVSRALAMTIGKVGSDFAAFYADLNVAQRQDVIAAQESIGALEQVLARERPFERDITQAIGSGSKNAIRALAGRWWAASERVGEVRDAVIALRRQPA
jgi:hypothetical protein